MIVLLLLTFVISPYFLPFTRLLDLTAIDSVSWRLSVWPHAVLVTAKMPSVRGASVFDLGAIVFLVYPLGSVAVLTRCNIVSDRLMDQ